MVMVKMTIAVRNDDDDDEEEEEAEEEECKISSLHTY